MKGVKHCGCLIHCRRYFVNALPKEKKAHPSSVAAEAVRYFDRIYHEEGLLVNMTADERYKERLVKIKPLLDGLFARLETVQVSGKSALAKAVRYALHEKPYFYTFLQDGNVSPDNNRERTQSGRLRSVARTGFSAIQRTAQKQAQCCIRSLPQLRQTVWIQSSI